LSYLGVENKINATETTDCHNLTSAIRYNILSLNV